MSSVFRAESSFFPRCCGYNLLPFRFIRLDADRYVATNEAGEWQVLARCDLEAFVKKELPFDSELYRSLKSKHFLEDSSSSVAKDLLALKVRSKRDRIAEFTSLFMFVVTLRCNHACLYCQASRQSEDQSGCDMTTAIADKAVDFMFCSPARAIKAEFQGGEPLLNFDVIRHIVLEAKKRNAVERRDLAFVIATNLSVISDQILEFCKENRVEISTSLDGPADLHHSNRPNAFGNSYSLTVDGIRRVRAALGKNSVNALMTTTQASLGRVTEIIDEYVRQGFTGIFLRSLSPYGYALKTKYFNSYSVDQWLEFYRKGVDYILEINRNGYFFAEAYTAMILEKMLTPHGTGFVNLQSPAGMGIAGIVFHYNGEVYPSDEARMAAEMGDKCFRMGNLLTDTYKEIMLSSTLLETLDNTVGESVPMCEECGFLPYCGCDPDYHHATQHDMVGHKALSGFCRKNMGIFRYIIQKYEDDPFAMGVFESWVR